MLTDVQNNPTPKEFELVLCKPNINRTQISILTEAYNINYKAKLGGIDELEFSIPYYINENHIKTINPNWNEFKGDYLVLVNDEKYFMIDNIRYEGNDKDIQIIHGFSLEYELSKKIIMKYPFDSRVLYSPLNEIDDEGYQKGVLNYISTLTSWAIGEVDTDLLLKNRMFDITSEKTILEFLVDVQKSYNCVFIYDTLYKTIHAKTIDSIGINRGLYITKENYIKTISEEIKHDEVVTRLKIYGDKEISINSVNPTGTDYIEDYSFYHPYMSSNLLVALDKYKDLCESKKTEYSTYLTNLSNKQYELLVKQNELNTLKNELQMILDSIDIRIKNNQSYADLTSQKNAKEVVVNSKQVEINTINNDIDSLKDANIQLIQLLSKENNFTHDELVELDYYTREKTWKLNGCENPQELYDEGIKALSKLNQPPMEFTIDVIDFLNIAECSNDWDKLVLGDIVNIEYANFGLDIQVRLVGYEYQIDNNNLKLEFSNRNSIDNATYFLTDIMKQAVSTSTTVDMSKYKWNKSEDNAKAVEQLMNGELDTAKNKIINSSTQAYTLDDRGLWLRDSVNPNEQLRIINNVLAMTTDNWNTARLAITPTGIISEQLIGKIIIGENLLIQDTNNKFSIDENGIHLNSSDGISIVGGLNDDQIASSTNWNSVIENFNNFVNVTYANDLNGIQNQIDRSITTWFYNYEPTLDNLPASDWTTDSAKDVHLGDMFYDTVTGYAYRFIKEYGLYRWQKLVDSDVTLALQKASEAMDVADNKRRVFMATPVPPYEIGDLWTGGITGDLKRCVKNRLVGETYFESDWELATRYSNVDYIIDPITGKIKGDDVVSAINVSKSKIEMSALNIDLTGYVTFNSLSQSGTTQINGSNITTGVIQNSGGNVKFDLTNGTFDLGGKLKFDGNDLIFSNGTIKWSNLDSTTQQNITAKPLKIQYSIDGIGNWHDTYNTLDCYMRQSIDGGSTWTIAQKIVGKDGSSVQLQYSVDGITWHDTFNSATDLYMRQTTNNGVNWTGAIRIVGTNGSYIDYKFIRNATQPSVPIGDSPSGWNDSPPTGTLLLWMIKGLKNGSGAIQGTWSTPIQLNGNDGNSVTVEYSIDGSTNWHSIFTTGDKYMHQKLGSGSWSSAIKIVGENGQPVIVKYSSDSTNWHDTFATGDIYLKQSTDGGITWTIPIKFVGSDGITTTRYIDLPDYVKAWNGQGVDIGTSYICTSNIFIGSKSQTNTNVATGIQVCNNGIIGWIPNSGGTASIKTFQINSNGNIGISGRFSTFSDDDNDGKETYMEIIGSKITGKTVLRTYYDIGTATLANGNKSGIFRTYSYRDTDNIVDVITDFTNGGIHCDKSQFKMWASGGMVVTTDGNGSVTTGFALDVKGDMIASRVFNAVWNDYAEYFLKDQDDIKAGDIVIKNPYGKGYIKSRKAYDNLVVGVYSDEYAHLIGGEGKETDKDLYAPIGLAGRVRVKVIGDIKYGDLIVTSDIEGVGMASKCDIKGTIIGKALEEHKGDSIDRIQMLIVNM